MDYDIVGLKWLQGFPSAILKDGSELHLWMPEWYEAWKHLRFIHSHSYLFTSEILLGELHAMEYRVEPNPDGEWITQIHNSHAVDLIPVREMRYKKGETYEFGGPDRYHKVLHKGPVMTHLVKLDTPRSDCASFLFHRSDEKTIFEAPDKPSFKEMQKAFQDIVLR